jgi:PAS domain S-box-containing protein
MRYVLALTVVLLVGGLRFALLPSPTAPFAVFYIGVALAASFFGLGPGLLALAGSAALANVLFAGPSHPWMSSDSSAALTLIFLGGAGSIAILCALFRRSLLEAHRIADLLRESREALVQSEAKARERTAELETVLEAVPAAVFITHDPEACTIEGNRLAYELVGVPLGRNLSKSARDGERPACTFLREGAEIASDDLPVQRAARGADVSSYAFDVARPDGTIRHLLGSAKPLVDERGAPRGAVGAFVDVTLLEQAKREARASERGLRAVADSMPQIVWAATPEGSIDYKNRKWYELTGADPRVVGDESWLPVLHPDDRQRTLDLWYESVRTGRPFEIEYRLGLTRPGEYRWHLGRALPVRDDAGHITRWYGTCTDLHDWKLAEEELRESARRKTEFLAMLSHELRNPLAPIRNGIYLLGRIDLGSEQARRALAIIDRQSQHLVRLVDDLLDMTRIERGKIHLQTDRLDLRALLAEVAEDHRSLFQNAGIGLEVDVGRDEALVRADSARLAQAVGNLLQNAAKFTPRGGAATLRLARDGATAVITVTDTGDGIPPEVMAQLFQPFVQGEKTLHRSLGGLGLGLALVKGLLELHGGTIRAESAGAGQGATFTVCLPLEPAASSDVRPSERLAPDLPPQPRREAEAALTRPR